MSRRVKNNGMSRHRQRDVVLNAATVDRPEGEKKMSVSEEIAVRSRSIDFIGLVLGGLPNPDPVLRKLGRAIEIYEDLLYDSRVTAVVGSRKSAIKAMEWDVTGENVPEIEIEFYKDLFKTYKMEDVISEMLDSWIFGYKPMEILWGSDGQNIRPVEFVGKPPRWFKYDENNDLRFISAENMITGELLPDRSFIVARDNATYDNPYGKAEISSCYWPVVFRKNGFKFWTVFLEKYGMPFLLAHAEAGAQAKRITEIADMLEDMVQDSIAVVPKDYEVQLLEAAEGKGKADSFHNVYINAMNIEIAMSILGTNLTTEVQGGSFAAAQTHMEVRADIIEADQQIVEGAFNELIRMTHKLNFNTPEIPKFNLYAEEKIDKTRAERDGILSEKCGVRFTKEYYQRSYNLQETDFEVGEPSPAQEGVI